MKKQHLTMEQLETRYTPATLVNPFTVTYSEEDGGEEVVVKINKPVFTEATINVVFTFNVGSVDGSNSVFQTLQKLDLSGLAAAGATLTIGDVQSSNKVSVGTIDATGLDLAAIVVDGDLQTITAGDTDQSTPGLGRLQCASLLSASTPSVIQGNLTKVNLSGDLSGFLDVFGSIASFKAARIIGQLADDSGRLRCSGRIGKAMAGVLVGQGGGERTGVIEAAGSIDLVKIDGNMIGQNVDSGIINSGGNIGSVVIGGSLFANAIGSRAARITADDAIGSVRVGVDVQGNSAAESGNIFSGIGIGRVTIGGDLIGVGDDSGSIFTRTGNIDSVKIGGSIVSGPGVRSGSIRAGHQLGNVRVAKDLDGSNGAPVVISGFGQETPGPNTDLAIGSVKINGNVTNAQILGGVNIGGIQANEDAQIGSVKVGGNWVGGSIAAGIDDGADNFFGNNDDSLINEAGGGDPNITARIGKISIGGTADGTPGGTDRFGFVAEEIASLSIDGVLLALASGASNDALALGGTGDFNLEEV